MDPKAPPYPGFSPVVQGGYPQQQGNGPSPNPYAQPAYPQQQVPPQNYGGQPQYPQQPYGQPQVVVVQQRTEDCPISLVLFIVGWFFPIAWIIGCCVPGSGDNVSPSERGWQTANRIMAGIMLVSIIIVVIVVTTTAASVNRTASSFPN